MEGNGEGVEPVSRTSTFLIGGEMAGADGFLHINDNNILNEVDLVTSL